MCDIGFHQMNIQTRLYLLLLKCDFYNTALWQESELVYFPKMLNYSFKWKQKKKKTVKNKLYGETGSLFSIMEQKLWNNLLIKSNHCVYGHIIGGWNRADLRPGGLV